MDRTNTRGDTLLSECLITPSLFFSIYSRMQVVDQVMCWAYLRFMSFESNSAAAAWLMSCFHCCAMNVACRGIFLSPLHVTEVFSHRVLGRHFMFAAVLSFFCFKIRGIPASLTAQNILGFLSKLFSYFLIDAWSSLVSIQLGVFVCLFVCVMQMIWCILVWL